MKLNNKLDQPKNIVEIFLLLIMRWSDKNNAVNDNYLFFFKIKTNKNILENNNHKL